VKTKLFRYDIDRAIGAALRQIRQEKCLTLRDLSQRTNSKHSLFAKIETYQRRITFGELAELADLMETTTENVIARAYQLLEEGAIPAQEELTPA